MADDQLLRLMDENRRLRADEPEMTLEEINAEIAAYRSERNK